MADRINVSGASSSLGGISSDYNKINKDLSSMLDNLKYLQENFYDQAENACTNNYSKISQSVYDTGGLLEMLRRVYKWCEKVDYFVEEEEKRIEEDLREAEEERRRAEVALKKGNE